MLPCQYTFKKQSRAIPFGIYRELSLTSIELPDWQYFTASFRLYITDLGKFHSKVGNLIGEIKVIMNRNVSRFF